MGMSIPSSWGQALYFVLGGGFKYLITEQDVTYGKFNEYMNSKLERLYI